MKRIVSAKACTILCITLFLSATASGLREEAAAQSAPSLRIKSSFSGTIASIDIDRGENIAAFAMTNKAAVLWSFEDATNPLFAWLPIRKEEYAKVHAIAVSPDGELIAASTPSQPDPENNLDLGIKLGSARVFILRRQTGEILRVIDRIPTRVHAMRFSPDGTMLAAVLGHGCHLRVWSVDRWELIARHDDYPNATEDTCCPRLDISECGSSRSLEFVEGRVPGQLLLVTTHEAAVRSFLYFPAARTFKLLFQEPRQAVGLQQPGGIAVSPDAQYVAIGDWRDRTAAGPVLLSVAILDPLTLGTSTKHKQLRITVPEQSPLYKLAQDWDLPAVAWGKTDSEEYILAAGNLPCAAVTDSRLILPKGTNRTDLAYFSRSNCIARWRMGKEDEGPSYFPAASQRIEDMRTLRRRGGIVIGGNDRAAALDYQGVPLRSVSGHGLDIARDGIDLRTRINRIWGPLSFDISADGKVIEIEEVDSTPERPLRVTFDLSNLRITSGKSSAATIAVDQDNNIVEFAGRSGWNPPSILGIPLNATEYQRPEFYHAAALLQDKKIVLLASDSNLRLIDYSDGSPRAICIERLTESALRVNISPDGKIAVSGHSDGTIRWYRVDRSEQGCRFELLVSVYLTKTAMGKWTWIAWQPSGQFAQDVEARPLLEWQVNQSSDRFCVIPFHQVHHYYNPLAIRNSLNPSNTSVALPDLSKLCPSPYGVSILERPDVRTATKETLPLRLYIEGGGNWPKLLTAKTGDYTPVSLLFGGKKFGPGEPITLNQTTLNQNVAEIEVLLPATVRTVKGADFTLCLYLDGARDRCRSIKWLGEPYKFTKRRLWALFIGVSGYADTRMNLRFAGNDAIDLASLFLKDFESRRASDNTSLPYDYEEVNISIAVSPYGPETKQELDQLGSRQSVKVYGASRDQILKALEDIVLLARNRNAQDPADDMLLFFIAAHGSVNPFPGPAGRTVFAGSETPFSPTRIDLERTGIGSAEILDRLSRFHGQILAAFDACWSLAPLDGAEPFDPSAVRLEFEKKAISAHIFFSADRGQQSREVAGLAFDKTRPAEGTGNGMFAYAMLEALTNPNAVGKRAPTSPAQIRIRDVEEYIIQNLFSASPNSWANAISRQRGWSYVQSPIYIPSRAHFPSDVIRTLEIGR